MHSFLSIFCITLFIYMFINNMLHPYTVVQQKYARGFSIPHNTA